MSWCAATCSNRTTSTGRCSCGALEKMRATPQSHLLPATRQPRPARRLVDIPVAHVRRAPARQRGPLGRHPNLLQAEPGVELIAAPWSEQAPPVRLGGRRLRGSRTLPMRSASSCGHGAVDSDVAPDPGNPALISLVPAAGQDRQRVSIHYVALGDRHSTTDVGSHRQGLVLGRARTHRLRRDVEPGNVLVVELDGARCGRRKATQWALGASTAVSWALSGDFGHRRRARSGCRGLPGDKQRFIVKVASGQGQVSVAQRARLDESARSHHRDLFGSPGGPGTVTAANWSVIPDDADLDDFGLSGYALEASVGSAAQMAESDDEQAVTAREASGTAVPAHKECTEVRLHRVRLLQLSAASQTARWSSWHEGVTDRRRPQRGRQDVDRRKRST